MKIDRNSRLRSASVTLSAVLCSLAMLFGFLFLTSEAFAQGLRRPGKVQQRIQRKIEKQGRGKLAPDEEAAPNTTKQPATSIRQDGAPLPQQNNLDGIRERGILNLFSREEAQLVIP
ncbi:MAG: hypothetical protein ABIU20_02810, partial [Blastocatellia bacterium]